MRLNTLYPCIQGEGCLTGTPMILVRFQGCSLRCPWCDTSQAWDPAGGTQITIEQLVRRIQAWTTGQRWVLLTGGEPLEQGSELLQLANVLHHLDYWLALETNGTHPVPHRFFDWVCISPKSHKDLTFLPPDANEIKLIINTPSDIPDALLLPRGPTICLQPRYGNPDALALCIQTIQERGWRLSLQTHKLINLP